MDFVDIQYNGQLIVNQLAVNRREVGEGQL